MLDAVFDKLLFRAYLWGRRRCWRCDVSGGTPRHVIGYTMIRPGRSGLDSTLLPYLAAAATEPPYQRCSESPSPVIAPSSSSPTVRHASRIASESVREILPESRVRRERPLKSKARAIP